MRTPDSLETLLDHGIIQEVVRPLMSGKEAQIYVVVAGGEECVAKVYKEASQRTFKHRSEYTEGRRTLNSRDQRAMGKRSRYGRQQDEAAWRSAEVDVIFRLRDAGVRVPVPHNFIDGVLVMELVKDASGSPAPRLGDLSFTAAEAREIHGKLLREVVRMLCAGVVHGDLSEFNVLMGADGPVLIDFPQAVDPARNQNARKLLLRDVENLNRFLERSTSRPSRRAYAQEMWALYEASRLEPETELSGEHSGPTGKANTDEVLALIDDAERDERERRIDRGEGDLAARPRPLRAVVDFTLENRSRSGAKKKENRPRPVRTDQSGSRTAGKPAASKSAEAADTKPAASAGREGAAKKRRTRRRRNRRNESGSPGASPVAREAAKPTNSADDQRRPRHRRSRGPRPKPEIADARAQTSDARTAKKPTRSGASAVTSTPSDGTARPTRRRRRRPRARRPASADEKGRPDDG